MEPKARFAVVGIFVVTISIVFIAILLWIIGIKSAKEYDCYIVRTSNSASGLHKDSSVRYKGVDIGKVSNIEINRQNPEYIDIYIRVRKGLPVTKQTKARISSNGLTGISYINLIGANRNGILIKQYSNMKCPIIKAVPTTLEKLSVSAPEMIANINKILTKINNIMDKKSLDYVHKTLKNTYEASKHIESISISIEKISYNLNELINKISTNSTNINETLKFVDNLTSNINKLVLDNKNNIKNFTSSGLENINNTAVDLDSTLQQLKNLLVEIKQHPSILIKGKEIKKGPGE